MRRLFFGWSIMNKGQGCTLLYSSPLIVFNHHWLYLITFLLQIEKKSKIEKRYCGENLQKSRMEPTVSKTKNGTIWSNHQQLLSPSQSTLSDSVDEIFWSNLLAKDPKLTQIPNVMWNVHSGFLAQNQYYPFTKWPRYA